MLEAEGDTTKKIRELSHCTYRFQGPVLHLGVMNEALTPKQLAAIKMQARKTRIRNIRQRVAISVATVSALFSGIILVGALNQQSQGSNQAGTTSIASTRTFNSSQQTADTVQVPVTTAPATTTTVAPAPTPPPVTTSQS